LKKIRATEEATYAFHITMDCGAAIIPLAPQACARGGVVNGNCFKGKKKKPQKKTKNTQEEERGEEEGGGGGGRGGGGGGVGMQGGPPSPSTQGSTRCVP